MLCVQYVTQDYNRVSIYCPPSTLYCAPKSLSQGGLLRKRGEVGKKEKKEKKEGDNKRGHRMYKFTKMISFYRREIIQIIPKA